MARVSRHPGLRPSHPGEIIATGLDATGVKKTDLAAALGVSRNTLYKLLEGRQSVTAEMAVRLEAVWGSTADAWLGLQQAHDLWLARKTVDVSKLHRIAA